MGVASGSPPCPRACAALSSLPLPPRRSAGRVLANRNFAPYFAGNLLSNCGTWLQGIAQTLLVYRLTGSTLLVGVVNGAQLGGVVLLAPWAGAAADRYDRRRLVIAMQLAAMALTVALAALEAAGRATVPVVIGLALALGCTTAFAAPAMQALIPSLVPREDVGAAIAMNSVTFNLARAVGPAAGAVVVARFGLVWAFSINALSYAALVAALLAVRPGPQPPRAAAGTRRMRDSLRLLRDDPRLLALLAVIAAVSVTVDPVSTLAPVFATRLFGRSDTFAGYLVASFGAGAVAASLLPAHPAAGGDAAAGLRTIRLPLAALVAGSLGYALALTPAVAIAALALAGAGFLTAQTRATSLLQLGVSDAQRGRVMALWSVAFLGSRPLASLADGALASTAGPRAAAVVLTVPALVAAAALLAAGRRRPAAPAL